MAIHYLYYPIFKKVVDFFFDKSTRVKVESLQYERFILIKGIPKEGVVQRTEEYGKMPGDMNYSFHHFEFAESGNWIILKLDEKTAYFDYYNLLFWYLNFNQENKPSHTIGFSKHKSDSPRDYLFFPDLEKESEDDFVGVFRNGKRFKIPEMKPETESTILYRSFEFKLSFVQALEIISEYGFDISNLKKIRFNANYIRIYTPE